MSSQPSCLSFLICRRKKTGHNKTYSRSNLQISTFQDFIAQKMNSSTQTPTSRKPSFKRDFSLPAISQNTPNKPSGHRSTIAVKKSSGFLPQSSNNDRLETTKSDYSNSSFALKLDLITNAEPSVSKISFGEIFSSKEDKITWNNKYSNGNPCASINDPFIAAPASTRARIIPITPTSYLRKRLFPMMLNNQKINENSTRLVRKEEISLRSKLGKKIEATYDNGKLNSEIRMSRLYIQDELNPTLENQQNIINPYVNNEENLNSENGPTFMSKIFENPGSLELAETIPTSRVDTQPKINFDEIDTVPDYFDGDSSNSMVNL